ncbi:MAG: acyltransferase [Steroidobacteraceae bacterium]
MMLINKLPALLRRITTGGSYKPEIDGLRFWAILPVVIWHGMQRVSRTIELSPGEQRAMLWFPEGWVGVALFLTISGFIISTQFMKARAAGQPLDLRSYFYRRVTRIEPPYLLLLLASYLFLTLSAYEPENAVAFWRGPESLTESLIASVVYLHGIIYNQMPRLFPGGWSLEVEVQFYIIAPALFACLFLCKSIKQRLVLSVVVLFVTLAVSRYFDWRFGSSGPHRYTLIRYFFCFWLGTLIAQINSAGLWPQWSRRSWDVLGFISLLAYLWSGSAQHSPWWPESGIVILDLLRIAAFLAMFGGAINGSAFNWLCTRPWICLVGGACYSIYLTHVQVMQLVVPLLSRTVHPATLLSGALMAGLLVLPLVLAAGLIFYACVERPFMIPRWPERLMAWFGRKVRRSASSPAV